MRGGEGAEWESTIQSFKSFVNPLTAGALLRMLVDL
jgi:hypothetical protein